MLCRWGDPMEMVHNSTVLQPASSDARGREEHDQSEITRATEFAGIHRLALGDFEAADLTFRGGESIGRFTLLERLGSGTFGTVWKGRDPLLDRLVAIKISHAPLDDEPNASMLLQEARLAAQLRHPNIVRVHEFGVEGDSAYIVSDLVDGMTMAEWLKAHRPSTLEAAAVCEKIARALHHAHERGVIHRDLKPGNIMFGGHGEPYVLDFGLGRRAVNELTNSRVNEVLGTPAYMPPEQACGKAHAVDGRADVYSLGVILFELLTGRWPFVGTMPKLLHQLLNADPPNPRELNPRVPRDLEAICLKCLAKAPDDRYSSAAELADDLRRFLEGKPVRARPIGWLDRSWRVVRRHPAVSGIAAALLIAIALATFAVIQGGETQARLTVSRAHFELLQDRLWVDRMTSLARSPQYPIAVAEAERMLSGRRVAPSRYYDAACVYSLAGLSAERDAGLSDERRRDLIDQYRTRALALLHRARDSGYFDSPDCRLHLRRDPQVDFLRAEEDFARFVQSLKEDQT